jgi:hypothetical protein
MTKEQILDKLYQAKDYASDAMSVAQQASELAQDAIDMVEELEDA